MGPPDANDFHPDDLVKEHTRNIQELSESIRRLSERLGDDDKFVGTFEAVSRKDKRIDLTIKESLRSLIATDVDVSAALEKKIEALDRAWMKFLGKRVGFAVWSVVILLIGALVGHFVNH